MNLEALGQRLLPTLYFLYAIALLVSMGAMEIISWTIAAVVLLVAFSQTLQHRQSFQDVFLKVDWAQLLLLIVVILGAFITAPPSPPAQSTITIIGSVRWVLLFYLLRLGMYWSFHDNAEFAFNTFLTIAGIVGVYAIVQHFTGIDLVRDSQRAVQEMGTRADGTPIYRSAGFFSGPMRYGNSYGIVFFFPLAGLMVKKHKSKLFTYLMWFSAIAVGVSLITTLTRGVWMGVIAGLVAIGVYQGRRMAVIMCSALVAVVVIVAVAVPAVRDRMTAVAQNLSMDDSRVQIWRANIAMFKDHPILGVGQNQNEYIIDQYFQKLGIVDGQVGHAHNTYLQFLAGTGILGFIAYMFFIIYFFVISHRLWRAIPDHAEFHRLLILGAIGAQVFIHVTGLTEPTFKHSEVKHMFLFVLAIVATLHLKYWREEGMMIRRPRNERPGAHGI